MRALALHDPRGILGRHDLCGTPCSRKREHTTQRKPWPTRSHWQDWHQYHRQFPLVAFTDRCSRATDHRPLLSRHSPLATRHYPTDHDPLAPGPLPSAGNWVRFSCPIPPLFVLSHSMPMINATGKLASFWHFSLTTGPLPSDSLGTDHWSLFFRPTPAPAPPADSGRAQTLPHWLLPDTDHRFVKDRTGSDLHERPHYYSVCHQTRRFPRKNQSVSPHSLPPNR